MIKQMKLSQRGYIFGLGAFRRYKESTGHDIGHFEEALFKMNVVPIVNENDTVAYDEIVYGDNDTLSAIVASLTKADGLVIFSDVNGLYDKNPHLNEDAKLIEVVNEITEDIIKMATGSTSKIGTGGMMTKIHAAEISFEANVETIIANGQDPTVLYDILDGKSVGTSFIRR